MCTVANVVVIDACRQMMMTTKVKTRWQYNRQVMLLLQMLMMSKLMSDIGAARIIVRTTPLRS